MFNRKRFSRHRIIPRNLLISLLLITILPGLILAASDNVQGPNDDAKLLIQSMRVSASTSGAPVSARPARVTESDGDLRSLSAPEDHYFSVSQKVAGDHSATARNFIGEHGQAFGVRSGAVDFAVKKSRKSDGRNYGRFQQSYSGIPVFGGEMIIQLNDDGDVKYAFGDIMRNTDLLDNGFVSVVPTISGPDAVLSAVASISASHPNVELEGGDAALMIYDPEVVGSGGAVQLVWKTEVSSVSVVGVSELVLVDAHTGVVALHYSLIKNARDREIYDADNSTDDPGTLVRVEGDPPVGIVDVDNAYDYFGDTYDFYFNEHGRDSIDDGGMTISATVRFCLDNATCPDPYSTFWFANRMYFGENMVGDDVTAHELTHGVTENESNLIYMNESGAINESLSDMWGEWIDQTNGAGNDSPGVKWWMGEDTILGVIRNMADPTVFGDPDSKCSTYWYEGTGDNGGVHINSGVGNKLCYLLTDGGTFKGVRIDGMGISATADLFYEAQTNLLTMASDYADLHIVLTQAALNLGWTEIERYNLEKACLVTELTKCFDPADIIDIIPPTPNPSEWLIYPKATGNQTVAMEAKLSTDETTSVQYYFEHSKVGSGDPNGNWQDSRVYQISGLDLNSDYDFRVKVKDEQGNETDWSEVYTVTTSGAVDNLSPWPDPAIDGVDPELLWGSKPKQVGLTQMVSMSAHLGVDGSGFEYRFERLNMSDVVQETKIQSSAICTFSGLAYGSEHKFRVKLVDSSPNANDTDYSSSEVVLIRDTQSQIFIVPTQFSTIQDALDAAAAAGDYNVVKVLPGTYFGTGNVNLNFGGARTTLTSEDPQEASIRDATIIDGGGSDRAFIFSQGEDQYSVVTGITMQNCAAPRIAIPGFIEEEAKGGAILCYNSSEPTISYCVIKDSTAWGYEGCEDPRPEDDGYIPPEDPDLPDPDPGADGADGATPGENGGNGESTSCTPADPAVCGTQPNGAGGTPAGDGSIGGSGGNGGVGADGDDAVINGGRGGDGGAGQNGCDGASGNDGEDGHDAFGGAIYVTSGASPEIRYCQIINCLAQGGDGGDGGNGGNGGNGGSGGGGGDGGAPGDLGIGGDGGDGGDAGNGGHGGHGGHGGDAGSAYGGAIYFEDHCSPVIENSEILDCGAIPGHGGVGGDAGCGGEAVGVPGGGGTAGEGGTDGDPGVEGAEGDDGTPGDAGDNGEFGFGGAIYYEQDCEPEISYSRINRNEVNAGEGILAVGGAPCDPADPSGDDSNVDTEIHGGGIYYEQACVSTITNSTIGSNTLTHYNLFVCAANDYGNGGGEYYEPGCTLIFNNVEVSYNSAVNRGGGLYIGDNSVEVSLLSGSEVVGNSTSTFTGDGGGVWIGHTTNAITIDDCEISLNLTPANSDQKGGGLYVGGAGSLDIDDTLINSNVSFWGGGLYVLDVPNMTIDNAIFTLNQAEHGGGMFLDGVTYEMSNSLLGDVDGEELDSEGNIAKYGGAILSLESDATIDKCIISGNRAIGDPSCSGGGLFHVSSDLRLTDSVLNYNYADGWGGAVNVNGWATTQHITNCLITENEAFYDGGGISCDFFAILDVVNCTIVSNAVLDDGVNDLDGVAGSGGGVSCYYAFVDILNSILWDNEAVNGPQIGIGDPLQFDNPDSVVMISYSDVEGGEDDIFLGDGFGPLALYMDNNITPQDPLFVLGYFLSDWDLQGVESPCIGRGDPTSVQLTGNPDYTTRTDFGVDNAPVDIGYHYYHSTNASLPTVRLTVNVVNDEGGVVDVTTSYGNTIPGTHGASHSYEVTQGQVVFLEAILSDPNLFTIGSWENTNDDLSTDVLNMVTADKDKTVTLTFDVTEDYAILRTTVISNNGTIASSNNGLRNPQVSSDYRIYHRGTVVTLTALPDNPASTVRWYGTDRDYQQSHAATVTLDRSKNVEARYYQPDTLIVGPSGEGAYTAIQLAIEAANEDDIIQVLPGVYDTYESNQPPESTRITIDEKRLTLRGSPEDPSATTIIGSFLITNVDRDTVIEGFTITGNYVSGTIGNGNDSGMDGGPGFPTSGGGMRLFEYAPGRVSNVGLFTIALPHDDTLYNGSPTVKDCVFLNCSVIGGDGGNGNGGTGALDGSTFAVPGEPGHGGWGGWAHGGAVAIGSYADPIFVDCDFIGNFVQGGDGGNGGSRAPAYGGHGGSWGNPLGGIGYTWEWGPYEEYWFYSGFGGAVYCGNYSRPEFIGCTFNDNVAYGGSCGIRGNVPVAGWPGSHYRIDRFGGAVYGARGSRPIFDSCAFDNNQADTVGPATHDDGDDAVSDDVNISFGGAVAFEDGSIPEFIDCVLTNNTATLGGAAYTVLAGFEATNTTFANNTALNAGGLAIVEGTAHVVESTFAGNTATAPGARGGAIFSFDSDPNIIDSVFEINQTEGSGGGIYTSGDGVADIKNCLVIDNIAGADGGGIASSLLSETHVSNCTVAGNTAGTLDVAGYGGGLSSGDYSHAIVIDSIFWGNEATYGSQLSVGYAGSPASTLTVSFTDIEGGIQGVYDSGASSTLFWGWGNINANPIFVTGALGDYYLRDIAFGMSPCIDAGSAPADQLGLGNYTTSVSNTQEGTTQVDMGYHRKLSGNLYTLTIVTVQNSNGDEPVLNIPGGVYNEFATVALEVLNDVPAGYKVQWTNTDNDEAIGKNNAVTIYSDTTVTVEFVVHVKRDLLVPTEYATIREALAAASSGDTIIVAPGIHLVNDGTSNRGLDFNGRTDITITSMIDPNNPDMDVIAQTIIDCVGDEYTSSRAFHFHHPEDSTNVVRGFTIINGYFSGDGQPGETGLGLTGVVPGVPRILGPDNEAEACIDFAYSGQNASGDGYGGAILIGDYTGGSPALIDTSAACSPTIDYCVFENNIITGARGGDGAPGLNAPWTNLCLLDPDGDPTTDDAEEPQDDAQWGGHGGHGDGNGYGGAIAILSGSSPTISNCIFNSNIARGANGGNGGMGGGSDPDGPNGLVGRGGQPGDAGASDSFGIPGFGWQGILGVGADGFGGAIYCDNTPSNPMIVNCTFSGNMAREGVAGVAGARGAEGNALDDDEIEQERNGVVHIRETMAGGAIYAHNNQLELDNCKFNENVAGYDNLVLLGIVLTGFELEDFVYTTGGAVYCTRETDLDIINGCRFNNNLAGALYCDPNCNINIQDSSFVGNSYPAYAGLFVDNEFFDIPDPHSGGAAYISHGWTDLVIQNTAFTENTCEESGGALYIEDAPTAATITDCIFADNTADGDNDLVGDGGAICFADPNELVRSMVSMNISGSKFMGNTASRGGAVYIKNFFDTTFTDCHFDNNVAFSGGGMFLLNGDFAIDGGTITNNRSTGEWSGGGGILAEKTTADIYSCIIEGNRADGLHSYGGGISFSLANTSSVSPPTPIHNIVNCLITDNYATDKGGGISCEFYVAPMIQNCTFSGNEAGDKGGALYTDWSFEYLRDASIIDSIFAGNADTAVHDEDSSEDVTIVNSLFYDNDGGDYDNGTGVYTGEAALNGLASVNGVTDSDPLFVTGPLGAYYLDPLSPAINYGSELSSNVCYDSACTSTLDAYTVMADGTLDDGNSPSDPNSQVDLGFHRDTAGSSAAKYILDIQVLAGEGTVEFSPAPIDPNGMYYEGTLVTLTARPSNTFKVGNWTGGTFFDSTSEIINYIIIDGKNADPADKTITIGIEFVAARVLHVGSDQEYTSIPQAVVAAEDGDIVIVSTGIWSASSGGLSSLSLIVDKGITIKSTNPENPDVVANTIIDGLLTSGSDWNRLGIYFTSNTGPDAVLDGFTIRNFGGFTDNADDGTRNADEYHPDGYDGPGLSGAAIIIDTGASPTIRNCVISNNLIIGGNGGDGANGRDNPQENGGRGGWPGWAHGAGVYCGVDSAPTFTNCAIINNTVEGGDGGNGGDDSDDTWANYGGGYVPQDNLWIQSDGPEIAYVELPLWQIWTPTYFSSVGHYEDDPHYYSGLGGGVFCDTGSKATFTDCVISGNAAYGGMTGVGGLNGERREEPLYSYKISSSGGGVYCRADSEISFTRCTITNNTADRIGYEDRNSTTVSYRISPYISYGGGVAAEDRAQVTFEECVISDNEAAIGGGVYWADEANIQMSDTEVLNNMAYQGAGLHVVSTLLNQSQIASSTISGNNSTVQTEPYSNLGDPDVPINEDEVIFGLGAGLNASTSNIKVVDSMFDGNVTNASGGGVYFGVSSSFESDASIILGNCLLVDNVAGLGGAGVAANWALNVMISNCTFADNIVTGFFGEVPGATVYGGGSLYAANSSTVYVTDSIFWSRLSITDPNHISVGGDEYPALVEVQYSDVQGGEPGVYNFGYLDWGDGNIDENPIFATGVSGEYYLGDIDFSTSPCIDAGSAPADEVGLSNYTTSVNHIQEGTTQVDMGYHRKLSDNFYTLTIVTNAGTSGQLPVLNITGGVFNQSATIKLEVLNDIPAGYKVKWTDTDNDEAIGKTNTLTILDDTTITVEFVEYVQNNLLVPSQYATIEEAIAAANSGDKIIVGKKLDGNPHYILNPEGIDLMGKALTITSDIDPENPDFETIASTIIDCQGSRYDPRRAFHFHNGEGENTVIIGLTIVNGYTVGDLGINGGIPGGPIDPADEDSPVVAASGTNAAGDGYGGAVLCEADSVGQPSSPMIKYCVFVNNNVTGGQGGDGIDGPFRGEDSDLDGVWGGDAGDGIGNGYGGAIAMIDGSSPTIIGCTFTNNSARGGSGGVAGNGSVNLGSGNESWGGDGGNSIGDGIGGAIYVSTLSSPQIQDCVFQENFASEGHASLGGTAGAGNELDPPAQDGSDGVVITNDLVAGGAVYYDFVTRVDLTS